MNKPMIIGVTAGIAAIGLSIPVYAAMSTPTTPANAPARSVVSDDSVTTTPSSLPSSTEPTVTSPASIPAVSVPENAEDTTENSTPTSVEDVSGPCDEAEHATDDRCTGNATAEDADDTTENTTENTTESTTETTTEDTTDDSTPTSVEDVSGPCDEAEHATDDRCTGTGTDDSSGRDGSGHGEDDGSSHRGHGGGNDG